MARNVNKVTLIGNVGSVEDMRLTNTSKKKVVNVSLATNGRKDDEGNAKVEWHRLVFWDRLAEIASEFVHKGSKLYIDGRIEYGNYEREIGGETVLWPTTDIVVRELVLLDPAPKASDPS